MSILCIVDHAGDGGREAYGNLGIDESVWRTHFALDLGAAALAEEIAERAGVAAVLNPVSRLYADTNRDPADPNCIPVSLAGHAVPGNAQLDEAGRIARIQAIHEPFHRHVSAAIKTHLEHYGDRSVILAVHSFNPVYQGKTRQTDIGFLTKHDPATAAHLTAGLQQVFPGWTIKENDPYSGWLYNYTMDRHCGALTVRQALIEVRNDHLSHAEIRRQIADCMVQTACSLA